MRLHLTTDPRQKHGIDVLTFNHNLYKSKKHINGYFIDAPFITPKGKELFYQFSAYIRQKDTIVAFVNGISFDFETFFDKTCSKELEERCSCFGGDYDIEFEMVSDHLGRSFGFNERKFNEIKRKKPGFGLDNGFVFIESIFVHPFYRKKGYATTLIKAIKKKYDGGLSFALSEQPFFIDDLSKLDIKDRKIDLGTLRALPKKVKNAKMCDMNSDFITKTFSMHSSISEIYSNKYYGDILYFCILGGPLVNYL
ncbi:GNAT family N-acetyltransferase [Thomasclavelia cocleata]|uniref:GNAT family N-acetyltransferase n=1 Tax=Thomasclavelia cocleata TaxID=69824 RepID=UPI00256EF53F|nr:GNAT family N-acetyltransferase [Thomasclavelia cocleata]